MTSSPEVGFAFVVKNDPVEQTPPEAPLAEDALFDDLLARIARVEGVDLYAYKREALGRRIARRMAARQVTSFACYVELLHQDDAEVRELTRDLLVGVTDFFRDPPVWDALARYVRALLQRLDRLDVIRAWVAGCSTGEEAYTVAMVLQECAERAERDVAVEIVATDASRPALDSARRGEYPLAALNTVDPQRRERFFVLGPEHARVAPSLRTQVTFRHHDVLTDAPIFQPHLITCRNVLLYFDPHAQRRALTQLSDAMHPDGALLLGSSESVRSSNPTLRPIDVATKLYRRTRPANHRSTWADTHTTAHRAKDRTT